MFFLAIGIMFVLLCVGIGSAIFGSFFGILEWITDIIEDWYDDWSARRNLNKRIKQMLQRRARYANKLRKLRSKGVITGANYKQSKYLYSKGYLDASLLKLWRERNFPIFDPDYVMMRKKMKRAEDDKRHANMVRISMIPPKWVTKEEYAEMQKNDLI